MKLFSFFRSLLHQGLKGKFLTSNGLDGWFLTTGTIGMAPSSLFHLFIQVTTLGFLRIIMWGHIVNWARIIRSCFKKRESGKKEE